MIYTIKCISGIHSKGDFLIKGGQEMEVSKEIYNYFNNTFGTSGRFTFSTKEAPKKVIPKVEEIVVEEKPTKRVSRRKSN